MRAWERLTSDIVGCTRCRRLRAHCARIAAVKRRAYRDQTYWGKPVPSFGDRSARIVLVGLAPAAHGANRTGRMFSGDDSGNWLYAALHGAGLANQPASTGPGDGLVLRGALVTATCRCAPPDNMPTPREMAACAPFLDRELDLLPGIRVVVALGKIAWDAVIRRAARVAPDRVARPRPRFGHGSLTRVVVRPGDEPVALLGSYHPSRQNTNTGRLTRAMLDEVMKTAVALTTGR